MSDVLRLAHPEHMMLIHRAHPGIVGDELLDALGQDGPRAMALTRILSLA